jgi:hypothetical protein
MDDKSLLELAKEGLGTPLPAAWKPCKTTDTFELYYFNFRTGESTWQHPVDDLFRAKYLACRAKALASSLDTAAHFNDGWLEAIRVTLDERFDQDQDGRLNSTEIRSLIVALGNDAAAADDAIRFLAQQTKSSTLHAGEGGYISVAEIVSFFENAASSAPQAVVANLRHLGLQQYIKGEKVGGEGRPTPAASASGAASASAASASASIRPPPNSNGRCSHEHCTKWLVVGQKLCKEHAAKEEQLKILHPWNNPSR